MSLRKTAFLVLLVAVACAPSSAEAQADSIGRHALVIGVSRYANPAMRPLRYADRDAEEFARFLRSDAGGRFQVTLLPNEQATREGILRAIRDLRTRVHPSDVLYVFFSGHGVPGDGDDLYLMAYGASPEAPEVEGIAADYFVSSIAATVSAQAIVFFLDACYSSAADAGMPKAATPDLATDLDALWRRELPRLLRGDPAVFAFYSASARQRSFEDPEYGHGVFSYYLLEGLRGAADGSTGQAPDGVVRADELHRYLERVGTRARSRLGQAQDPAVSPRFVDSFPLSVYRNQPGVSVRRAAAAIRPPVQRLSRYEEDRLFRAAYEGIPDDPDSAAARRVWERFEREGELPYALYHLGSQFASEGEAGEAIEIYRQVLLKIDSLARAGELADRSLETIWEDARSGILTLARGMRDEGDADQALAWLCNYEPAFVYSWAARAHILNEKQQWDSLSRVAARFVELAPLDESARVYLLNAYRGMWTAALRRGDSASVQRFRALATEANTHLETLPVKVFIQFTGRNVVTRETSIDGAVVGNHAPPGTPIRLRFTFTYLGRPTGGTVDVQIMAPRRGGSVSFSTPTLVLSPLPTNAYYEVLRE